jgi:hypothetical protein
MSALSSASESMRAAWRRIQDREPVSVVGNDLLRQTTRRALESLRWKLLHLLGD